VETLILRWGYLAVGLGTFFEGETILIAAGAMAHRGLLSLWWVIGSAFVGSLAGDQLWFLLGRRYGQPFIAQRPKIQRRTAVVEGWLHRYGTVFVLGFRFLYGLRSVTPVLLGASRYAPSRFLGLNAVGAALWALSFGYLGYGVGASLAALLDRRGRVEELLLAGLAVGVLVALLSIYARRKKQRAAVSSADGAQCGGD
jgi:membrane protein DedA with SNARE-associated domain